MTLDQLTSRPWTISEFVSISDSSSITRKGRSTPRSSPLLQEHKPHLVARLVKQAQWEALRHKARGPGLDDETPAIDVVKPDRAKMMAASPRS